SGNTSSLAVAKYSGSGICIANGGNDLSILFPTICKKTEVFGRFSIASPSAVAADLPPTARQRGDSGQNGGVVETAATVDGGGKNSGSTTIPADISLLIFDHFHFKIEPDPGELTSIVDSGIRENIFLPFLMYLIDPPYLLSSGNEDTIFDLEISIYHSLFSGVSYRSGTFMKFNVYPNHLNESPMEILSSTCSPIDQ
nr:hypothetical protein [Tanacetum cinerariifolium]